MDMSSKGGYALVYKYKLVEREGNLFLRQKCMHLNIVVANKYTVNFNSLDFYHYKQYIVCLDSCIDRIVDTEVHPYVQPLHVKWQLGFLEAKKLIQV